MRRLFKSVPSPPPWLQSLCLICKFILIIITIVFWILKCRVFNTIFSLYFYFAFLCFRIYVFLDFFILLFLYFSIFQLFDFSISLFLYVPFWVPFSEYSVHLHFSPIRNIETACVYMNKQFNRNIESKRVLLRITVVSWCQKNRAIYIWY